MEGIYPLTVTLTNRQDYDALGRKTQETHRFTDNQTKEFHYTQTYSFGATSGQLIAYTSATQYLEGDAVSTTYALPTMQTEI